MNTRKWVAGFASVAMASTLLAGCSSNGGSSDGKTLTVSVNQELTGQFSPMYAQSAYDQYVVNLVYQGFMKYDENNELVKDLAAEDPVLSEDGKTLTLKLKEGVKFSDGTDLTSEDVKYTYTVMADPSYTGPGGYTVALLEGYQEYHDGDAKELTGVETPDDYTVVFHLQEPQIDAVSSFATGGIASSEQFDYKKGDTSAIEKGTDSPIGSGAYKLNSYEKATGASFVRNEEFKREEGTYNIDRVIMKKTDITTELQELKKGNVDLMPEVIESTIVGEASNDENIAFNTYTRSAEGFLAFNTNNGATKDQAVRQALSYATDRQGFVDSFFAWDDKVSDEVKQYVGGYVPQAYWNPVSKNNGKYVTGEDTLEGLTTYEFNPEKAKQILDAAGWVVGADGIREKDGQKLEIKFLLSEKNSVLETLVPMVEKTWGDIGVDLKQTTVDFTTLLSTVQDANSDGEWNVMFMATSFTSAEDTGANQSYDSEPTNNYSRLNDAALNDLIAKGRATGDVEASNANYQEAMKLAADLCGYLPMYSGMMFNLYNKNVDLTGTGPLCNWSQAMATIDIK